MRVGIDCDFAAPAAALHGSWDSVKGPSLRIRLLATQVESDAPRHAEVAAGDPAVEIRDFFEEDLFEHPLEAPGDVLVKAEELRLGGPGGRSEELDQAIRVHSVAPQKVEVLEVEDVLARFSLVNSLRTWST